MSPFLIAIYYGDAKPNSLTDYLNDFIHELNDILEYGLSYDGNNFKVTVVCFTCDAPARAFLKNIKGHMDYKGSKRCTDTGICYNKRINYIKHDASAQTHFNFENFHDLSHH